MIAPKSQPSLTPVAPERLQQIVSRLLLHFSSDDYLGQEHVARNYMAALMNYPEDLLCAAYHNVLLHYTGRTMPSLSYFFTFMDPEMQRRQSLAREAVA